MRTVYEAKTGVKHMRFMYAGKCLAPHESLAAYGINNGATLQATGSLKGGAGGALLSLVAYGAQDVYISGNATVTHWRQVVRRHTPFALEEIEQTINGSINFGQRVTITVSRNGDLMKSACLVINMPVLPIGYSWVSSTAYRLCPEISMEIGGQKIDTLYGEWCNMMHELNTPESKITSLDKLVGRDFDGKDSSGKFSPVGGRQALDALYLPLTFWFAKSPSSALALIALQYHEVKFNVEFAELSDMVRMWDEAASCWVPVSGPMPELQGTLNVNAFVEYCFLDTSERRKFATSSHEVIISQTQYQGTDVVTNTRGDVMYPIRLNLNHPVSALVWSAGLGEATATGSLDPYDCRYAPKHALALEKRAARGQVRINIDIDNGTNGALAADTAQASYVHATVTPGTDLEHLIQVGDVVIGRFYDAGTIISAIDHSTNDIQFADATDTNYTTTTTSNRLSVLLHPNIYPLNNGAGDFAIATGMITKVAGSEVTIGLDNSGTLGLITMQSGVCLESDFSTHIAGDGSTAPVQVAGGITFVLGTAPPSKWVGQRVVVTQPSYIFSRDAVTIAEPFHKTINDVPVPADGSSHPPVSNQNPLTSVTLSLNGHERFSPRPGDYFEHMQTLAHAPRCPKKPVMMYSFALSPFDLCPSGTTNFSRIDTAIMQMRMRDPAYGAASEIRHVNIFARSWNLLRLLSGMGGVAFSN